ncbi:Chaperone protein DnaJ [Diplonema papillatum]|nr:Chaperone protein DnaJ [Diplonema papillatum]
MTQALERGGGLYEILGVAQKASVDEVKKAYRQKAVQYHPDKNIGDEAAAEVFKQINHAHQVLTDPAKKTTYDRTCGSDAAKFCAGLYKSSNFQDMNDARKTREQELYRKRASRQAVFQGETRRTGSSMPDAQREYWKARDKEREREMAAKIAREKEELRSGEMERQRYVDLARQRAEEGRRRESERAANKSRQIEAERERAQWEEAKKREKAACERQRQEEARKRELERQLFRHQKQAEKLREQKVFEDQARLETEKSDAVASLLSSEQTDRKTIGTEQGKTRKAAVEQFRATRAEVAHREELCGVEGAETLARAAVAGSEAAEFRLRGAEGAEAVARDGAKTAEYCSRRVLLSDLSALLLYWARCYQTRQSYAASHIAGRQQISSAEASERLFVSVLHGEIRDRLAVEDTHAQLSHCVRTMAERELSRLHETADLSARESRGREAVEADRKRWLDCDGFFGWAEVRLRTREADERAGVWRAWRLGLEESDAHKRVAARKKLEAIELQRVRSEHASFRSRLEEAELALRVARRESDDLRHQLDGTRALAARADQLAGENERLKAENRALLAQQQQLLHPLQQQQRGLGESERLRAETRALAQQQPQLRGLDRGAAPASPEERLDFVRVSSSGKTPCDDRAQQGSPSPLADRSKKRCFSATRGSPAATPLFEHSLSSHGAGGAAPTRKRSLSNRPGAAAREGGGVCSPVVGRTVSTSPAANVRRSTSGKPSRRRTSVHAGVKSPKNAVKRVGSVVITRTASFDPPAPADLSQTARSPSASSGSKAKRKVLRTSSVSLSRRSDGGDRSDSNLSATPTTTATTPHRTSLTSVLHDAPRRLDDHTFTSPVKTPPRHVLSFSQFNNARDY